MSDQSLGWSDVMSYHVNKIIILTDICVTRKIVLTAIDAYMRHCQRYYLYCAVLEAGGAKSERTLVGLYYTS